MATNYYLVINGVAGDYSDKLLTGAFKVDAFDFAAAHTFSAQGPGKPSFTPLHLTLNSKTLAALLSDETNGKHLPDISLVGESTVAGAPAITYSLNLADVLVTNLAQSSSSAVNLTLDYGKIGLVTHTITASGTKLGPPQSFGWDVTTNQTSDAGVSLTSSGSNPASVTPTAPTTYYLLIDGLNGGSQALNHQGWFQLSNFSIDLSNTATIGSGGGGAGAGKAKFGQLSVTTLNQDALTSLLSDDATGKHLTGVRIEGVSSTGAAVYDLNLASVLVTNVADPKSGGTGISFDYGKVSLVTKGQDQKGSLTQTGSFGWDVVANRAIDPNSMPGLAVGTAHGNVAPTSYYLVINGVAGDYSDKLLTGAFKVSEFGFAATNSGTTQTGGGAGAGKVSFGPLDLTVDSNTLATLLADTAQGKLLPDVSLVGESTIKGVSEITYSLNLATVGVVDVAQSGASSSGLVLAYDKIGLVTTGLDSKGTLQTSESFGWDIATNSKTDAGVSLKSSGATPAASVTPTAPTTYYLLIDGFNGGALDLNHKGWFQLNDFSIDLSNSVASFGGGAGAGKAKFGQLSVTLNEDALTSLLSDDGSGKHLTGVRIEGVSSTGAAVYDLNLADVLVTNVADSQSGVTAIKFDYGKVSLVTKGDQNGKLTPTGSFGWDVLTNQKLSPSSMPGLAVGTAHGNVAPTSYYLVINGVAGDYSDKLLSGAFKVSAFDFAATNSGSVQGGLGAGKASFGPLHLTVDNNTLAALLLDTAEGKHLANVSLVGESTVGVGGASEITYSLNLAQLLVTDVAQEGSPEAASSFGLTLDYTKIGLVTTGVDSKGTPQAPQSFGWNIATNSATDAGVSLKSSGTNPASVKPTAPTSYFLLIDGLNGGSLDRNHKGWFQLNDFHIDLGNTATIGSGGGGGGAGKAMFGKLTVQTASDSLTSLLGDDTIGKQLKGLRIEGLAASVNGATPQAVYDLNLADVFITGIDEIGTSGQPDGQQISFDYGRIALVTEGQDQKGSLTKTGSFGWDRIHNQQIDPNSMPSLSVGQPCYCPGTLILTDRGEVPVEQLVIGDALVTMSGATRPIRWIGRRSYAGRFAFGKKHILPICFKAGALGKDLPRRDLWISPHHAMYLDGILIEAKDLVNGVSIVQAERVEQVVYFHIELDSHDVIIAEGALSESYIDDDNRNMFHNAQEYYAAYPDAAEQEPRYCAPRCDSGYAVEAVRQRIEKRAGLRTADDRAEIRLRGYVDRVGSSIEGWAQNVAYPEAPVCLDIYANGKLIGSTLANRYREDLERAGLGSGRHSFAFTPPQGLDLASHAIEVRRSFDGAPLPRADTFAWRRRPRAA